MNKLLRIISVFLLLFLGFGGAYGAMMLLSDPTGAKFGWPSELLDATPFNSYLLPGIVLLCFIGILPLVIAVFTIKKRKYAALLIIIQGAVLIGWLTAELIFNPAFFVPAMHYPSYAVGILLLANGMLLKHKVSPPFWGSLVCGQID